MANISQAAKVGAFVIASGAATYGIWRVVAREVGEGDSYVVHAYLDDATGVAPHTRVTTAGIPIGTISQVFLENGRARVDLRIKKDVLLYRNATAGKKSTSLLGEYAITVTPGTTEPVLKNGDEIATLPPDPSIDD